MKKLYIIDGNSYIHRAYHALPVLTTSRGEQVNAVYGFVRMLMKLLKKEHPEYVAVCFDAPGKTFRHKQFTEYKATRKETEPELAGQFPLSKESAAVLGLTAVEKQGYEADDIIATLVRRFEKQGYEVIVISGDKDILQLVNQNVKVLNEPKNTLFDREEVYNKYGLYPENLVDMFALAGDASDNVPGVPGVGEKTAVKLLQQYGSLEEILKNSSNVKGSLGEKLTNNKDKALLSKQLVTLDAAVPVPEDIEAYRIHTPDQEKLVAFIQRMEFSGFLKDMVVKKEEVHIACRILSKQEDVKGLIKDIENKGSFVLQCAAADPDTAGSPLIGITVCLDREQAYYIPFGHSYLGVGKQLERDVVLSILKPVIESDLIPVVVHDVKFNILCLKKHGIGLNGVCFDTMIGSYLLNPSKSNHDVHTIVFEYFNDSSVPDIEGLTGKGKNYRALDSIAVEDASTYMCAQSSSVLRLRGFIEQELKKKKLYDLLCKVELPLAVVLADMEHNGIAVDREYLSSLRNEFGGHIESISSEIYKLSGEKFNINSPKQLAYILFEKQKLPPVKKTKTGYSTNEEVLRTLSPSSKLAGCVLEYRELQKLMSTYIESLLELADKATGRIHTSFNQTVTATGRLSSSEPNLQNIPIRTESGKKIRRAFIAGSKHIFIAGDYSQIDLRVLAHLSEDPILCRVFNEGGDVHTTTASEIFGIPPEKVTLDLRRTGKTINFGIVYGMSSYGLSKQLDIDAEKAQEYIDAYFIKYAGVQKWINAIIKQAGRDGYVTTLLNHIRYLPDMHSKNKQIRSFAERTAVNTPVQGGASDIVKIAMINIHKKLSGSTLTTKMLLQVHDDLLFEVPESEVSEVMDMVKTEMEGAYTLKVPLVVDMKKGLNWDTMK